MRKNRRNPILVLGPGPRVRGGITSVIRLHSQSDAWRNHRCYWLSTYDDRSAIHKITSFLSALSRFLWLVPQARIVHIHLAAYTSFYRKSIFFLLSKIYRRRTILHLHAPDPAAFERGFFGWWSARILAKADQVVVLSDTWAQHIQRHCPHASVVVIPNPASCRPREQALSQASRVPAILYAGKLEPRKGYADLIRALSMLDNSTPRPHLHFAGHGEIDQARQLCQEAGVLDSVTFHGWVSTDQRDELLAKSLIFCLPSFGEGVPMSMLEAMGAGAAIVTTPVGGIPDVIEHGRNGLLVQPGNPQQIADAIRLLLHDKQVRCRLTKAAWDTVHERFSLSSIGRLLDELYTIELPGH